MGILLMHYFYWTHNQPKPAFVDVPLFLRIVFGETRHVWDQYYPVETWRSWCLWEGPFVLLVLLATPVLFFVMVIFGLLLWLLEGLRWLFD